MGFSMMHILSEVSFIQQTSQSRLAMEEASNPPSRNDMGPAAHVFVGDYNCAYAVLWCHASAMHVLALQTTPRCYVTNNG